MDLRWFGVLGAPLGAPENFYTFCRLPASISFNFEAIWTPKMIISANLRFKVSVYLKSPKKNLKKNAGASRRQYLLKKYLKKNAIWRFLLFFLAEIVFFPQKSWFFSRNHRFFSRNHCFLAETKDFLAEIMDFLAEIVDF